LSSAGNVDQNHCRWTWWVPEDTEGIEGVEHSTLRLRSCRQFWNVLEASRVAVMLVQYGNNGQDQVGVEQRHSVHVAKERLLTLVSQQGLHYSSPSERWLVTSTAAAWLLDRCNSADLAQSSVIKARTCNLANVAFHERLAVKEGTIETPNDVKTLKDRWTDGEQAVFRSYFWQPGVCTEPDKQCFRRVQL